MFRLEVDRDLFREKWCQQRIDKCLMDAAYQFPGLRVEAPTLRFISPRGLAELACKIAKESGAANADRVWWFNDTMGDLLIQAANL